MWNSVLNRPNCPINVGVKSGIFLQGLEYPSGGLSKDPWGQQWFSTHKYSSVNKPCGVSKSTESSSLHIERDAFTLIWRRRASLVVIPAHCSLPVCDPVRVNPVSRPPKSSNHPSDPVGHPTRDWPELRLDRSKAHNKSLNPKVTSNYDNNVTSQ